MLTSYQIEGQQMTLTLNMRRGWRTDLANRTFTRELLETATPEAAVRNLREIARINRWFGGHAALIRMMRDLVHSQERFSVLDVGAASGIWADASFAIFRMHRSCHSIATRPICVPPPHRELSQMR